MTRFLNWLQDKLWPEDAVSDLSRQKSAKDSQRLPFAAKPASGHTIDRPSHNRPAVPRRQPDFVNLDPVVRKKLESRGPGKNVLIRNKLRREDTGTHDTLKILDDSVVETEEKQGFDPYNTGQFDRSRNWDKHTK